MNVFGRTSFIISLAFTLLISGITLFYYVNRFKHLEKTIIEQGRILQSFIIKSENQKCNLSSTIALDSAKQQMNKMSKDDKIEVSDDECHYDNKENIKLCKKKQMEKAKCLKKKKLMNIKKPKTILDILKKIMST